MDKLQAKSEKQYYIPMEVNETSKEFRRRRGGASD